jgi:hypothetical protein
MRRISSITPSEYVRTSCSKSGVPQIQLSPIPLFFVHRSVPVQNPAHHPVQRSVSRRCRRNPQCSAQSETGGGTSILRAAGFADATTGAFPPLSVPSSIFGQLLDLHRPSPARCARDLSPQRRGISHSTTFGTMKNSSSAAGAFLVTSCG